MSIEDHLHNGEPKEAAELMRRHPKYTTDRRFQEMVSIQLGRVNRLQRSINTGTISSENERIETARITQSLLHIGRDNGVLNYDPDLAVLATVLFLSSNPGDVLQMETEFTRVHGHLQDKKDAFDLLSSKKVTRENVRAELLAKRPTHVHFSGHGIGADNGFQRAGLVFESSENRAQADVMPAPEARAMFELIHSNAPLKLVLLNACESAEHAKLISTIGCYSIGMTERIKDTDAVRFAEGFYLGLANATDRENPVPFAFASGIDHSSEEVRGMAKLFVSGEVIA